MIYKYKSWDLQIKDVDRSTRIVKGRFAAFGNKDSDGDVIVRGAFARTITERGPQSARPRIKHILNHDISQPLGKLLTLEETAEGLDYSSQIGTHRLGNDFLEMVESGLVTEHSIGFRTIKGESKRTNDDYYYEIQEVQLWEGSSLTAWGANENTPLLKGKTIDQLYERSKAIEKFCRNSGATDETIELLLIENKQLLQLISDLKEAGPAEPATDPLHSNQPELNYKQLSEQLELLHLTFKL